MLFFAHSMPHGLHGVRSRQQVQSTDARQQFCVESAVTAAHLSLGTTRQSASTALCRHIPTTPVYVAEVQQPHLISINIYCQKDQRGVLNTEGCKHWPNHFARPAPAGKRTHPAVTGV